MMLGWCGCDDVLIIVIIIVCDDGGTIERLAIPASLQRSHCDQILSSIQLYEFAK